ncbi:MAG: hypothetical protein Unbinned8472contig1000_53 [Prokaryotic dsDNA virus sp.]|nr:MAG: hypothetical protein Unbinned8472contig1000_53 [Prokaryotic dsDNA virus sp.]|tara:strand:+ start:52139 stop:52327 length:189 start_codon:yes stop_codon:yes gene_type:complete
MKIEIEYVRYTGYYYAVDMDTYNGDHCGSSQNKLHAVLELLEVLQENEVYTEQEILDYLGVK